jgi:DNA invertase Pin-like site-specific DNA recombinase
MAEGKFVSYLRVSTARQGRSGLGLEAQRKAVEDFLNGGNWQLVKEFVEVESGKRADRPQLEKAFQLCRLIGAKLVIAKLDRLSRDAHFLLGLEKAGVEFVAADMPQANRLTIGIMAVMAQHEREMISTRTKAALQAAKRRGVKLGGDRGYVITAKARAAGRPCVAQKRRLGHQTLPRWCKSYRRPVLRHCGALQRAWTSAAFLRRGVENGLPPRWRDY